MGSLLCKPEDRYQFQPWYIKLWRRRYLILVPYFALKSWWKHLDSHEPLRLKHAWSIERGWAEIKMQWWITAEEMKHEERITRTDL